MNKKRAFIVMLLAFVLTFVCAFAAACNKKADDVKNVEVTSVTLDKNYAELQLGVTPTVTLAATVAPDNATDKTVTWTSSVQSVATVSESGVVTADAPGSTIITATAGGKSATCRVVVNPAPTTVAVTGVSLDKTAVTLKISGTESTTLVATVSPANATNKSVTWLSSDTEVATVAGGVVTAKKAGTATITVKTEDGNHTATCEVTVEAATVAVESVSLSNSELTLRPNGTANLTANVSPASATNRNVTWSSSNTEVATVANGVVTAVGVGTADITVKTEDGEKTATCVVTVTAPSSSDVAVTGVTLDKTEVTLKMGGTQTATLVATVAPANATNKSVTWTSSDATVATVANGEVTAHKAGTATITVKTVDGNFEKTCAVTVQAADPMVERVTVTAAGGATTVANNGTLQLTATVTGTNNPAQTVTWSIKPGATATGATVSNSGLLSAGTVAGTVTVIATSTVDNTKFGELEITVQPASTPEPTEPAVERVIVTSVTGATTVANGGSLQLNAAVVGTNDPAQTVTWSIKSGATATGATVVNGLLSAGTVAGTVTVIATSTVDNTKSGEIIITVQSAEVVDPGYTADGTYVLDIEGEGHTPGIYTWVKATGDGAFGTNTNDSKKYFKVSSKDGAYDYLYVNLKLPVNKIITITGTARTSNLTDSTKNTTVGVALKSGSTGAVSGLTSISVTQAEGSKQINLQATVTTEGTIVIQLSRTAGNTGCEFLSFSVTISSPEPVNVQSVTLDKDTSALKVGETETLTATVNPANADNTTVLWTSSNITFATVDANGVVTAIKKGTVTITATSAADSTKKASCTYTITNVAPTSVTLNKTSAVVEIGDTVSLKATVAPATATIKTVTWSSSNEAIATVDNNGVVTAVAAGNVTITAACTDDANVKATCSIEVKTEIIDVTGISLNETSIAKNVGDTLQLTATITPDNADDKSVEWTSSNTSVATVSASGFVTIVGEGNVTITATSSISTIKANCVIDATYIRYTVNFNDGDSTVRTQSVIKGEKATYERITKDGFALVGWYTDSAKTNKFDFNTPITADITLYAKWEVAAFDITYSQGNLESAALEWDEKNASAATVSYKLASADDSAYVAVDSELIRQVDADTARVDVVGLKGGVDYTFKIKASNKGETVKTLSIKKYDRSGYAHFNYTSGVGAYKDDGTLKDNAIVLYVTDENKNTVTLTYGGVTVTGIGNILNTSGMDTGSGTNAKGGKPNTNQNILKKLADANIPLVVRFIGCVSDSGLYSQGTFSASSTPKINGLSIYDSIDMGGSVGDNGHMARMKSAKDVTLEGVGEDATIDGWGFHFMCESSSANLGKSFEVRNLVFINTPEDAVGMEGVQASKNTSSDLTASVERCWIHNNEFYSPDISSPAESDKSEGDGSCDFKRGQYLTCSYNYFEGCHKTNLVGSDDSSLQYNLTYHHNYWKLCKARGPLSRNANIHMYNNVFEGQTDFCMNTRANAYIFSEYNMFYMCKSPHRVDSGVIKSYNDSFSSCINLMEGTIVSSRSQIVPNNCQFAARNIDYSKFDTTASQSYIPTGDYELQESVTEARKVLAAYCGVTKRNVKAVEDIALSEISYLRGVTPVKISVPSTVTPGKISKTVYAFTITSSATVTISYDSDALTGTGVLVNEAGECLLTASGSVVLNPGTYMIQPTNFQPGDSKTVAYGTFKEMTINSIKFEEYNSDELDAKLLADYNAKATAVKDATIAYDTASYQLIANAQNAYALLSAELQAQVTVPYSTVTAAYNKYVDLGETHVEGLINAIGTVDENSDSAITKARSAYSQLISVAPEATVSNYATLTAAESAFEGFKVTALNKDIADLADPATATTEEAITSLLEKYNNVKDRYEGLSDEQKAQVTNYTKVTNGIATLTAASAPYDVKAMIAALPAAAEVTRGDATAITAARKAYDALTAEQKTVVGDITKLTAAEAALAELSVGTEYVIFAQNAVSSGASVSGKYKTGLAEYTVDGKSYTTAVKMESSTSVSFTTTASTAKVTIVFHSTTSGTKVKINGNSYTIGADKTVVLENFAAGKITITKDSTDVFLCYAIVEA